MKNILSLLSLIVITVLTSTQLMAQCEAESGLPIAPATVFSQCDDDISVLTIQEWEVEPSGTTHNTIVVTHASFNDTLTVWDSPIVGVTEDGIFDFTDMEPGTYCFHAFSYNQAELDSITNFPTIQALAPCLSGGEDLGTILACIGSLGIFPFASINGAIGNVLGVIVPTQIPAFSDEPPCYDPLPEGMEYCIEVTCTITDIDTQVLSAIDLKNHPNPFRHETLIQFNSSFYQNFNFKVYNALGSIVYKRHIEANSGLNTIPFNASNFNSGVYMYELSNANSITIQKMMVQ